MSRYLISYTVRKFPIEKLHAVASQKSKGSKAKFGDELITVEALDEFSFTNIDIAFFSAGGSISKEYATKAAKEDCIVIDNTSEFRYVDNIPLVVPEVNPEDISKYKETNIIANPNCSTIQMLVALKPLHDEFNIQHINVMYLSGCVWFRKRWSRRVTSTIICIY